MKIVKGVYAWNYAQGAKGVYYIGAESEDGGLPLKLLDLTTKRTKRLAILHGTGVGLSVSADGTVAYAAISPDRRADLRMVEDFR